MYYVTIMLQTYLSIKYTKYIFCFRKIGNFWINMCVEYRVTTQYTLLKKQKNRVCSTDE